MFLRRPKKTNRNMIHRLKYLGLVLPGGNNISVHFKHQSSFSAASTIIIIQISVCEWANEELQKNLNTALQLKILLLLMYAVTTSHMYHLTQTQWNIVERDSLER